MKGAYSVLLLLLLSSYVVLSLEAKLVLVDCAGCKIVVGVVMIMIIKRAKTIPGLVLEI